MRITFIRHGESVSNAAGIWQGHANAELSDRGRAQAEAVAERLRGEAVDRIVCSDLARAHATAEAIGAAVGRTPEPVEVWREIHLGRWEGLRRDEVAARYPDEIAALARGEDIRVGGGERWSDLLARIGGAFTELATGPEDHVIVVVHGGVIVTLLSDLLGVFAARPRPVGKLSNTSLTRVEVSGGRTVVRSYNDALHVDAEASWTREMNERGRRVTAMRPAGSGGAVTEPEGDGLTEITVLPEELHRWATDKLGDGRRAELALPQVGSRCLSVASRSGGTVWSWNEGL